jgi:sugar phosphate isomerase/epimerase
MNRRTFLAAAAAAAAPLPAQVPRRPGTRIKIGLNAYSFNRPLTAGTMKLDDLIDYCAAHDIDGVDLTGYYFPGYPAVPPDDFLYAIKKRAYLNGVTINGTGVRNDFATADAAARKGHIELVKSWTEAAQKLGAGVIRVFSGLRVPEGRTFEQVLEWMVPAFRECAEHGRRHGVIIGLQHHDDFLKTAEQTIRVVKAVNSEWFHVILDVGSLRQGDPYAEIEKLVPYACTWQVKENVWYGAKQSPIDLPRLRGIIEKSGFRGFLPIEALGQGDPATIVTAFLEKVRKAMA